MRVYLVCNYDQESYQILAGFTGLDGPDGARAYMEKAKERVRLGTEWKRSRYSGDAPEGALTDQCLEIVALELGGAGPDDIEQWSGVTKEASR